MQLDAHGTGGVGNLGWPCPEEVRIITRHWDSGYLLIDDFVVPGKEVFGADGAEYTVPVVAASIPSNVNFAAYYPRYTALTSPYHFLRGWVLLQFWRMGEPAPARLDTAGLLPYGILSYHEGHSRVPMLFGQDPRMGVSKGKPV